MRKAGNTLRVTAQLIRADNGYHLWSETYDRNAQDIFKVQDEIAARVVDALKVSLPTAVGNSGRTENAEAYNQYLLGKNLMDRATPQGYASAEMSFRRAIALDPGYAAAYSQLALAEAYWSDQTGDDSGLARAPGDAERAIALAPDRADGYFARGYLGTLWLWDWTGARADFKKALALDPNNSEILQGQALLLEAEGDLPGAIAAIDKAARIDPLRAANQNQLGLLLVASRSYPAARAAYQRLLEIDPGNPRAYAQLAIIELLAGQPDQAVAWLQKPRDERAGGWGEIASALLQHTLGHDEQSRQLLEHVINRRPADLPPSKWPRSTLGAERRTRRSRGWTAPITQRDGGLTRVGATRSWIPCAQIRATRLSSKKMQLPQ